MFVYILKREIDYDSADTVDKIKYSRIPKSAETQQENATENTKKITETNWD